MPVRDGAIPPLPAGGGEMRDLVIGASRLSESELTKIAAGWEPDHPPPAWP